MFYALGTEHRNKLRTPLFISNGIKIGFYLDIFFRIPLFVPVFGIALIFSINQIEPQRLSKIVNIYYKIGFLELTTRSILALLKF